MLANSSGCRWQGPDWQEMLFCQSMPKPIQENNCDRLLLAAWRRWLARHQSINWSAAELSSTNILALQRLPPAEAGLAPTTWIFTIYCPNTQKLGKSPTWLCDIDRVALRMGNNLPSGSGPPSWPHHETHHHRDGRYWEGEVHALVLCACPTCCSEKTRNPQSHQFVLGCFAGNLHLICITWDTVAPYK